MKNNTLTPQEIDTLIHDINAYKYWVDEFKKVLRASKFYGLNTIEIKQAGNDIKKYRLIIKQKEAILNTIK